MAKRTVRLDEETEKLLEQLVQRTGLSISAVFKQGLIAFRDQMAHPVGRSAYELYEELDLGPGGYALAPSSEPRRDVQEALRRKLGR